MWMVGYMKFYWNLDHRGKFRKYLSHIGGYMADYINSELQCRAGKLKPTKQFMSVGNGAYTYIFGKLNESISSYLDSGELWKISRT